MGDTASRKRKLPVAVAITLAFVSIVLAPTIFTDKDYWRPVPFVIMSLLCIHLVLGSNHARQTISGYLTLFGAIRVLGFAFALVMGLPVARNVVPLFGAALGLVAAGILDFSKPLREFVRVQYEARSRRQTIFLRAAWIVFLVYFAVITYLDVTGAADG